MDVERFTLDTNILIYSIDSQARARQRMARKIIDLALRCDCWLTLQAVSEFYAAATRKGRMEVAEAAAQPGDWLTYFRACQARRLPSGLLWLRRPACVLRIGMPCWSRRLRKGDALLY